MSSKTQRLQKYMVTKIMTLEGNMEQWAAVDACIGEELGLRVTQVTALRAGNTQAAHAIHNQRVACLRRAVEILSACPVCGPGEEASHDEG